jgi:hypothetical protein
MLLKNPPLPQKPTTEYERNLNFALSKHLRDIANSTNDSTRKLDKVAFITDYGADLTGTDDSSEAFTAAIADGAKTIICPFGIYKIKDISIGDNVTIEGQGSVFKPMTSATYIFKMTAFRPKIYDAYFDGGNGNLGSTLNTNAAVFVEDASYPIIDDCQFVNVGIGLHLRVATISTSSQTTKGSFTRLKFDTISTRGILVGPNVNACTFYDIRMYVGVETPDYRPKRGCIGFQVVGTSALAATGGHMIDKVDVEQAEYGFQFTDATLCQVSNCFADSLADAGFQCTGACAYIKFTGCFAGTCLIGWDIAGTSSAIWIDSMSTILQGVVPPWWVGPGSFFNAGTAYDLAVKNTASVHIGSWFGDHAIYMDSTTTIKFENGDQLYSDAIANVPAATTTYFGPAGENTTEFTWVAPYDGLLYFLRAQSSVAPGVGQTYTYTTRVTGVDTTQVATTSGTAFGDTDSTPVTFSAGDNLSVKLVTSAGAAAGTHRIVISLKYFQ